MRRRQLADGSIVDFTDAEELERDILDADDQNDQLKAEILNGTQNRLDDFAKTRNYDSILSACTYATSAVPSLQTEGQYCITTRDATWMKLYAMLDEVEAGTRTLPTSFTDIEPELPVLVWPS